jgi:integrase
MPYVCRTGIGDMARTLRDAKLDTRNARLKLKIRREPYWRSISEGLGLGYRKGVKGGTWIARHYCSEHGRRYQSIGTADDVADADSGHVLSFAQAQEAARVWFRDLARGDHGDSRLGPYTVAQCIEDYLSGLEAIQGGTADKRYSASANILPYLGDVLCAKLTTSQIQKWFWDLASSPAKLRTSAKAKTRNVRVLMLDDSEAVRRRRASANRTLTILKAALNRGWREGKIPSDQGWRRVRPFEQVDAARVRYLTVTEGKRLVNAATSDFRPLVQAALVTAARYSELAALCRSDFNPDSGTVHVRTSKAGKGRHIILNDEGIALFRSLAVGKAGDAVLIPRADGSRWGKSVQARRMSDACQRGQITPPIGFHGLRHTYASLSVMNGAPLLVVAKNLGHSDTRMVEKHYGHLAPSYIADAIRATAPKFDIEPSGTVVSIEKNQ